MAALKILFMNISDPDKTRERVIVSESLTTNRGKPVYRYCAWSKLMNWVALKYFCQEVNMLLACVLYCLFRMVFLRLGFITESIDRNSPLKPG